MALGSGDLRRDQGCAQGFLGCIRSWGRVKGFWGKVTIKRGELKKGWIAHA